MRSILVKPVVYSAPSKTFAAAMRVGNIKDKNEWLNSEMGLVVFDEYHFGAWRRPPRSYSKV